MELLERKHAGEKMLTHLHQVLTIEYPNINIADLAIRCNLEKTQWWKAGSSSPLQDFITLFNYLSVESAPSIGYSLARQAQFTDLGMMGYAMMTAPNISDFIEVAGYALNQINFPVNVRLQEYERDTAAIVFTGDTNGANFFNHFLEFTMALSWHYIETIRPSFSAIPPSEILFTAERKNQQQHTAETFYGASASYNAAANAIIIPNKLLNVSLSAGRISDIVACSLQLNQILASSKLTGKFQRKVEQALVEAPHICNFSFSKTAAYLGIKERQLKSYLDSEKASFRKISMQLRMQLAQEYLKSTNFQVKHIAYLLSYQEPNNFIRAFSKHVGTPPRKFREREVDT